MDLEVNRVPFAGVLSKGRHNVSVFAMPLIDGDQAIGPPAQPRGGRRRECRADDQWRSSWPYIELGVLHMDPAVVVTVSPAHRARMTSMLSFSRAFRCD